MHHVQSLLRWLVEVEREWIGWTLPPPQHAADEAAWRPDVPDAYCGRCGCTCPAAERTDAGCGTCRGTPLGTDRVVRLGAYRRPLRDWVRSIKYRQWDDMARWLGHRLGDRLAAMDLDRRRVVVVPMPMPWARRLYRGIDHADAIATAVATRLRVPVVRLLGVDNGPPQVALSRSRRARRAMQLRRRGRSQVRGTDVVLVDDVRTTGATLNAAARLLRRLGTRSVIAGVVAVTDDPARR